MIEIRHSLLDIRPGQIPGFLNPAQIPEQIDRLADLLSAGCFIA